MVVVNPNNPTGRLFPPADLAAVKGLLVVDESFIDFLPREMSLAGDLPPRTVVLRSFGKSYGLAGLRLGFAIASPDIAVQLRAELGPWAVSGPALEIGRVALNDGAWLRTARDRVVADSARLDDFLREAGFEILGGTVLFRLARHAAAPAFVQRLARRGHPCAGLRPCARPPALRIAWRRRGVLAIGKGARPLVLAGVARAASAEPLRRGTLLIPRAGVA